jgi:hypothetical protein
MLHILMLRAIAGRPTYLLNREAVRILLAVSISQIKCTQGQISNTGPGFGD